MVRHSRNSGQVWWGGVHEVRQPVAGEWVVLGEVGAGRVFVDVGDVLGVVGRVGDAVFVVALLPDVELAFEAEGEASLDELNCLFEGDVRGGREQDVDVVRHDCEGVEERSGIWLGRRGRA